MIASVILLIEHDLQQALRITRSIELQSLPRPIRFVSGGEAISWAETNPFGVCVVDYDLPDMDGLATIDQLRQRQGNLPMILISSPAERAVRDAVHRRGIAFVPKGHDCAQTVATLIGRVVQPDTRPAPSPSAAADDLLTRLHPPGYQNWLRAIGRQLDINDYRRFSILEVEDGFVTRAFRNETSPIERLEFSRRDYVELLKAAMSARGRGNRRGSSNLLLPTGYEDFLRALGYQLDQDRIEALSITELDSSIIVAGMRRQVVGSMPIFSAFHRVLGPDEVARLLNEAIQRRESARPRA